MTILITGASGFLGSNLYNSLAIQSSNKVFGTYYNNKQPNLWNCNLTKIDQVFRLCNAINPTIIIHCAAIATPNHPKKENLRNFLDQHILSTTNLLECNKNIKFIYISSINIYGSTYPIERTTSLYGACKASCEELCRAYSQLNSLNINIVRPCAIVGKDTTHGLLHDMKKKVGNNLPYVEALGSTPGSAKPYVHIDDMITCVSKCINNEYDRETLDVFPKDYLNVKQVIEIIMDKTGIKKTITWLGEQSLYKGDNKLIDASQWTTGLEVDLKYKTSLEAIENAI